VVKTVQKLSKSIKIWHFKLLSTASRHVLRATAYNRCSLGGHSCAVE